MQDKPELQVGPLKCPVCGDCIAADPKKCPRCDAPHHPDCWEYLPGCAVYACADTAPREHAVVSKLQSIISTRLMLLEFGAWVLLASAVYVIVGRVLLSDRMALTISGVGFGLGALFIAASVQLDIWSRRHGSDLQLSTQRPQVLLTIHDDVLGRVGSPLGISASTLSLGLWAAATLVFLYHKLFVPMYVGGQAFEMPWAFFWSSVGAVTLVCGLLVYPILAVVNRLAVLGGFELRRVEAAIDQDKSRKPVKLIGPES